MLVQYVGVQARVHAFAGSAGAEGAAAAEERLESGEGVDVRGGDGEGFEGEVDVRETREGGIRGWRKGWEGDEAAGVVGWSGEINWRWRLHRRRVEWGDGGVVGC